MVPLPSRHQPSAEDADGFSDTEEDGLISGSERPARAEAYAARREPSGGTEDDAFEG